MTACMRCLHPKDTVPRHGILYVVWTSEQKRSSQCRVRQRYVDLHTSGLCFHLSEKVLQRPF